MSFTGALRGAVGRADAPYAEATVLAAVGAVLHVTPLLSASPLHYQIKEKEMA